MLRKLNKIVRNNFIPDFARTQKTRTNSCAQNTGITPPEAQNLKEILPGGPSGGFCKAKSGFIIEGIKKVLSCQGTSFQKNVLKSSRGQIAIVLMMLIAIALIFYAVSLNMGRLSQTKTLVTVASNQGASFLASEMASKGQQLFKTTLGGQRKLCASTSILEAIIVLILIIIIIYIYPPAAGSVYAILSYLSIALAVVNLALQVVVVQPGISRMWAKEMARILSVEDQFIEGALQTGLQNSVTDQVQVPDVSDLDQDRIFGFNGAVPNDKISRYGIYYNARLQNAPGNDTAAISAFVSAIKEFVYRGGDTWGMWDPVVCPSTNPCCYTVGDTDVPSECNPCCQPKTISDPTNPTGPGMENSVTKCCDNGGIPTSQCGTATAIVNTPSGPAPICEALSPYGANYPFVYDPFYDDPTNGLLSFRERLGRDDENRGWTKDPLSINGINQVMDANPGFKIDDTTGYLAPPSPVLSPPPPPPPVDRKRGVYPFLWKISDWPMDLGIMGIAILPTLECYWFDERFGPECNPQSTLPREFNLLGRLRLPNDPTVAFDPADPMTLRYEKTWWVDGITTPIGVIVPPPIPPGTVLAIDKFGTVPNNIEAADNICAENMMNNLPTDGFWKKGADRFCTPANTPTKWPYYSGCTKHNNPPGCGAILSDCSCTDQPPSDPTLFQDDAVDDLVYGISEFLTFYVDKIGIRNINSLASEFTNWYEDLADWIEPPVPPAVQSTTAAVPCFKCSFPNGGALYTWRDEMREILNRLRAWRDLSYVGNACDEVWCVPPTACDATIPPEEVLTFDTNGNGIRGDIQDIVQCLNYNVEGYDFTFGTVKLIGTNQGNDYRFDQCRQTCSTLNCDNLPRSVIPQATYDPTAFNPPIAAQLPNEPHIAAFLKCLEDCNAPNCYAMPLQRVSDLTYYFGTTATGDFCDPITPGCTPITDWTLIGSPPPAPPVLPPAPTITFSYSASTVPYGGLYDQIWNSTNATNVTWTCTPAGSYAGGNNIATTLTGNSLGLVANWMGTGGGTTLCSMTAYGPGGAVSTGYIPFTILASDGSSPPPPAVPSPLPTIINNYTPSTVAYGGTYRQTWSSMNATSVTWSCSPAGTWPGGTDFPTTLSGDTPGLVADWMGPAGGTTYCNMTALGPAGGASTGYKPFTIVPLSGTPPLFPDAVCPWDFSGAGTSRSRQLADLIIAAISSINPACMAGRDPVNAPLGWVTETWRSFGEAQNQIAKFRQRRNILNIRLQELDNMISIFNDGQSAFDSFLNSDAVFNLIKARIALLDPQTWNSQVVYGWQDKQIPKNRTGIKAGQPYWHVVKVEAKIPKRCDDACSATQGSPDPGWPRIITYTKRWGLTRCYELVDTEGSVKFRVVRFDENKDTNSIFHFPNGVPIWEWRSDRRDRPGGMSFIGESCAAFSFADPPGLPGGVSNIYGGAFLLSDRTDINKICWDAVHSYLGRGIMSETCARYFFDDATQGMNFTFVPCAPF